jgi:exonuclease VII small subunit
MPQTDQSTLAYYTVIDDDRTGWTGGLLLLNSGGRPLEFQCTLPVRPSRAHTILFGPTLRDHLIGDVIGPLLVQKCRAPISMLCCDQPEALRLEESVPFPVVLVDEAAEESEGPIADDSLSGSVTTELAGSIIRFRIEHADIVKRIASNLGDFPDAVEPFERIREAIKEAHSQLARAQQPVAQTLTGRQSTDRESSIQNEAA